MQKWRLLEQGRGTGAWNMAVDEAIYTLHARGRAEPTLRFYGWEPACLSLGRLQKSFPLPAGTNWVRRPTGGRAVWHEDEVTYAVMARLELLPAHASSVVGAYRWVSEGLLQGLLDLGVPGELAAPTPVAPRERKREPAGSNCFTVSTADCDFTVHGRKLVGAAQCRKEDTFLQHGSLLLSIRAPQWERAAGGGMGSAVSLQELGILAPKEEVQQALAQGFAARHRILLEPGGLTEQEEELANWLHASKYSTSQWNLEGRPSGLEPPGAPIQGQATIG